MVVMVVVVNKYLAAPVNRQTPKNLGMKTV